MLSDLVIYTFTFRYSLTRWAFPKAKYSRVCTEFPMCSKFCFSKWEIDFSLFNFSEILWIFHPLSLKCDQPYFL